MENKIDLKQDEQPALDDSKKKKDKNALLALSGVTRGKLGPFIEKEDRIDVRECAVVGVLLQAL